MKISVECQSPLLQKSLEIFLVDYLCSTKQCDIVVRDRECINDARCFYIATDKTADLIKPFSKSQLILALEERYSKFNVKKSIVETYLNEEEQENKIDFSILERRIDSLTKEYQKNVINAVKAFYEK